MQGKPSDFAERLSRAAYRGGLNGYDLASWFGVSENCMCLWLHRKTNPRRGLEHVIHALLRALEAAEPELKKQPSGIGKRSYPGRRHAITEIRDAHLSPEDIAEARSLLRLF